MSVDRYTKVVLTAIAAGIFAIVAQNAVTPSHAQSDQIQRVAICDIRSSACASVSGVAGGAGLVTLSRPLSAGGAVRLLGPGDADQQ